MFCLWVEHSVNDGQRERQWQGERDLIELIVLRRRVWLIFDNRLPTSWAQLSIIVVWFFLVLYFRSTSNGWWFVVHDQWSVVLLPDVSFNSTDCLRSIILRKRGDSAQWLFRFELVKKSIQSTETSNGQDLYIRLFLSLSLFVIEVTWKCLKSIMEFISCRTNNRHVTLSQCGCHSEDEPSTATWLSVGEGATLSFDQHTLPWFLVLSKVISCNICCRFTMTRTDRTLSSALIQHMLLEEWILMLLFLCFVSKSVLVAIHRRWIG